MIVAGKYAPSAPNRPKPMIRSRGVAVAKKGIARTRGGAADRATEAAAATQTRGRRPPRKLCSRAGVARARLPAHKHDSAQGVIACARRLTKSARRAPVELLDELGGRLEPHRSEPWREMPAFSKPPPTRRKPSPCLSFHSRAVSLRRSSETLAVSPYARYPLLG